jgi:hypothetical protein
MCKCEWLKKLLGMKKDCCCHAEKTAAPTAPVAAPTAENTAETSVNKQ